jgi:hypothetical protein
MCWFWLAPLNLAAFRCWKTTRSLERFGRLTVRTGPSQLAHHEGLQRDQLGAASG